MGREPGICLLLVIPLFSRLRQGNGKFEATLRYIGGPGLYEKGS